MYNDKIKCCIYKWREENKDKYNDYMRDVVYVRHCEKIKAKRMNRYYLEKELKIFREILL
jgi:hypothetical protein